MKRQRHQNDIEPEREPLRCHQCRRTDGGIAHRESMERDHGRPRGLGVPPVRERDPVVDGMRADLWVAVEGTVVARELVPDDFPSGDRIVPPEQPLTLWKHWGEPAIHWYAGGHVTPFRRFAVFAAGADHVRRLGILA